MTRPIVFSAPMVTAILRGRKTMTRRLAWAPTRPSAWQDVRPGEQLWVREMWAGPLQWRDRRGRQQERVLYAAGDQKWRDAQGNPPQWRTPYFLPRAWSRLTLTVERVRMERLTAISDEDAAREGVWPPTRERFFDVWDAIHGRDAWLKDPEVVVVQFSAEMENIDRLYAA